VVPLGISVKIGGVRKQRAFCAGFEHMTGAAWNMPELSVISLVIWTLHEKKKRTNLVRSEPEDWNGKRS
jgi:hypothetical protein